MGSIQADLGKGSL
jgi:serine/threonine protein kinase